MNKMNDFFTKMESYGYRSYFIGFVGITHLHFHFKGRELLSVDVWLGKWMSVLWDNFDGIFELKEEIIQ